MVRGLAVVAVASVLAVPSLAAEDAGRPPTPWVRTIAPDGKSITWSITDSGGRGAELEFQCDGHELVLHTKESLLEMADADDGEIAVVFVSPTHPRLSGAGHLSADPRVLKLDDGQFNNWLRFKEHGQVAMTLTVLLSNNGKRETYEFVNRLVPQDEHDLDCELPKKPKQ